MSVSPRGRHLLDQNDAYVRQLLENSLREKRRRVPRFLLTAALTTVIGLGVCIILLTGRVGGVW